MARYLIENAIWLFAQFVKTLELAKINGITDRQDLFSALVRFVENEWIKVDPKYVYSMGTIGREFSRDNGGIYDRKGHIVLKDKIIYKKLIYSLRHFILRTPKKIEEYKNMKFVPDFYINSTDFIDKYSNSTITCSSFNVFKGATLVLDK